MTVKFDGKKSYSGNRQPKMGTDSRPAMVSVQTDERANEIAAVFDGKGWKHQITVDPDQPEELAELEMLRNPPAPVVAETQVGRNAPCPCDSGKKFKKCCGR